MTLQLTPEEAKRFKNLKKQYNCYKNQQQSTPITKLKEIRKLLIKGNIGHLAIMRELHVTAHTVQYVRQDLLKENLL